MKLMQRLPKEDYDRLVAACDVGMIFLDHRFTIPNFPSRLLGYMQAGLPVLAESATMSIRRGFFSHFSSAEEEFLKGDARGRFDQEAREIASILDRLTPYSLLLLNETFQTTSYKEGTKSIYDILRFMPKLKTKYVFVTHLTALFGYMEYCLKYIYLFA